MASTEGNTRSSTSREDQEMTTQSEQDAEDISATLTTVRFRGQPRVVHELYKQMTPEQISAMMQTEFRGTLKVGMKSTLPGRLVLWLMRKVDPDAKTLTLGKDDKKVVIDLKKAAPKVFLLRNKGKTVPVDPFAGGRKGGKSLDIGSESPGKNGKKSKMVLQDYLRKMKTCTNSRKATYRIYKYAIFSSLLAPNSSLNVERRLKNMLRKAEDWNWSDFIVDYLVKSISEVLSGESSWLVGCPLLLVVSNLEVNHVYVVFT